MARPSARLNYGVMSTERTVDIPNFSEICDLKLNVEFHTPDFVFQPHQPEKLEIDGHLFSFYISLKQIKEEEWISVSFSFGSGDELYTLHFYNLSCTLYLKNIDGILKFPLSFVLDGMEMFQFMNKKLKIKNTMEFEVMEKYLSRKKMLNESTELLPKDALTLHFEINMDYCDVNITTAGPAFMRGWALRKGYFKYSPSDGMKFNINSTIYPSLCKESVCFQGLQGSGMKEENEGWVNIPHDEVKHFAAMLYFIEHGTLNYVNSDEKPPTLPHSLRDATLSLYVLADKYGVIKLQSFCKDLLMQYTLSRENAERVHFVADLCNDQELKNYSSYYMSKLKSDTLNYDYSKLHPLEHFLLSISQRRHENEFDFYS